MQATRYAPCTGACRHHGAARASRSCARRAVPWPRCSCALRPPWRSSRSIRPSRPRIPRRKPARLQRVFWIRSWTTSCAANGPTILNAGNTLWRGLAAIVVVWTGVKIAMSGTFSMWAIVRAGDRAVDPVGDAAPSTPRRSPPSGLTFPGMIAGGGNWLHSFFLSDIVPADADRASPIWCRFTPPRSVRCVGRDELA